MREINTWSELSNIELPHFTGIKKYPNGDKEYYFDGNYHRADGPAIEHANGFKQWWYYDKQIDVNSQEEFESWLKVRAFE